MFVYESLTIWKRNIWKITPISVGIEGARVEGRCSKGQQGVSIISKEMPISICLLPFKNLCKRQHPLSTHIQ